MYTFSKASEEHHLYEARRLDEFLECKKLFQSLNSEMLTVLKQLDSTRIIDLIRFYVELENKGNFSGNSSKLICALEYPVPTLNYGDVKEISLKSCENLSTFFITNGWMVIAEKGYYWSEQKFSAEIGFKIQFQ